MGVVVPLTRQEFVRLPCVSVRPLPGRADAEPAMALAAREAGIDLAQVRWDGDILLMASVSPGRVVTVRARAGGCVALHVFAPGVPRTRVASGRFAETARAELPLDLRAARVQHVAAVAQLADGSLHGVVVEVAVIG